MQWNPATLDEIDDEKINLVFNPLEDGIELYIPEREENRSVKGIIYPKILYYLSNGIFLSKQSLSYVLILEIHRWGGKYETSGYASV